MAKARELILKAMDKHSIAWPDVQARIVRDEDVQEHIAASLVEYAKGSGMPVVVAAAIITLIADKREAV